MRRFITVVPLFLVFVGCGTSSNQSLSRPNPATALQASLLPPTQGIGFYVNKSAHLALFDIVPGAGIGLVYPRMGRELNYAVRPGPRWITSAVPYMSVNYREPDIAPVHYLFLVASRQPLNIEDYVGYSDYLRAKLGNIVYTGTPYTAMKALIGEVVPPQPDEDWTTAVYIVYGGTGRDRGRTAIYRLVICPDNQGYWVPIDRDFLCSQASDSSATSGVLKEGEAPPREDPKEKRKDNIRRFDDRNLPEAAGVVRSAMRVQRPPMALPPRTESQSMYSGSRSRPDERGEPVLSGVSPSNPTPPTPAVTTPAQEPSNSRGGRVSETP